MALIDRQLLAARRLSRRDARRQRRKPELQAADPICMATRVDVGTLVARAVLEAGLGDVRAMEILKEAGMSPAKITATITELRRALAAARNHRSQKS